MDHFQKELFHLLSSPPSDRHSLQLLRSRLLGKNGLLTSKIREMTALPLEERKLQGKKLNELRLWVEKQLKALEQKEGPNAVEVGLPRPTLGRLHPLQSVICDIRTSLEAVGFVRIEAPQVESVKNNFDRLRVLEGHPSRAASDTFYLNERLVLRTHTTGSLLARISHLQPPFMAYCIGPTYRNDEEDATHTRMFHQLDLVVVRREGFSLGHLKSLIQDLLHLFLEEEIELVPAFFPFTEPSTEAYLGSKELLGGGLLHPNVLKMAGHEGASGLALGMGIERVVGLKTKVKDIRDFQGFEVRDY